MMTFAVAAQAVSSGDLNLRFDVDPSDTSKVGLTVVAGGVTHVLRFHRNGALIGTARAEPSPRAPEPHAPRRSRFMREENA